MVAVNLFPHKGDEGEKVLFSKKVSGNLFSVTTASGPDSLSDCRPSI